DQGPPHIEEDRPDLRSAHGHVRPRAPRFSLPLTVRPGGAAPWVAGQATLTLTMSEWRRRIARATFRFLPAFPIARAFQAGSTVTVTWRPFPFGARSTRFGEYQ